MRRITDYMIVWVTYGGVGFIQQEVNDRIRQGWQPLGGIAYDASNDRYMQAMVKYAGIPKGLGPF